MRLHPVNPAECIIAPFFDPGLSNEEDWTIEIGRKTVGFKSGRGYSTMFNWDAAEPGVPAFSWEWRGSLDLDGFDALFLQAAAPSTATIRFSIVAQGEYLTVTEEKGCDCHDDYYGHLPTTYIEGFRIEIIPHTASAGAFSTYYIGAHNSRKLEEWVDYEEADVYPADWPEFIKPRSDWTSCSYLPEIGITFDEKELDAIRDKAESSTYANFAGLLRDRAHACLTDHPEREIRHYARCGEQPYAYSARKRDRGEPLWRKMELCAFFGLLDKDPALVEMAARYAISLAHCDKWSEGFVEHDFRGSAMNWRAFYQNYAAIAMSNTLDWIGFALTDHAKEVLCHSLYYKALVPLKYDMLRYEYIYHMNQAVVFSFGRIAAALALDAHWPRLSVELQSAKADLDESAFEIIHDDGGYGEGPGYYSAVLFFLFGSYIGLGRKLKQDVVDMVPAGALKCADYLGAFIATTKETRRLPVSDGGIGAITTDWVAMAASLTGNAKWNGVLNRLLQSNLEEQLNTKFGLDTSIRTLIHGPKDLSRTEEIVPTFTIHTSTGHATSRREVDHGPVRIHLCGASADEGHSHGDKGSFILEVFGESVFIDRGTPVYSDPLTGIIKETKWHNAITFIGSDGLEKTQINPCPGAVCPVGSGNEESLNLETDLAPAWGAPVIAMSRKVDSPDPYHICMTDTISATDPVQAVFNLHAYTQFTVDGATATVTREGYDVLVRWSWEGDVICSGVDLSDGAHRDVHRLAIATGPGKEHTLRTEIEIRLG